MAKVEKFLFPENEGTLKGMLGSESVILAGGTMLGRRVPDGVKKIVSLKKMGWNKIEDKEDSYVLEAMVDISSIVKDQKEKRYFDGLLYTAAKEIGSTLNRNMVTVGGNITAIYPWSDLPVAFSVLEGEIETLDGEKITFENFFKEHPAKSGFGKEKAIKKVIIKKDNQNGKRYFWETLHKSKLDFGLTTVAGMLKLNEGKVEEIKLVVGNIYTLPQRLTAMEEGLKGKELTEEVISAAWEAQKDSLKWRHDFMASREYLEDVTKNLLIKNMMEIKEGK